MMFSSAILDRHIAPGVSTFNKAEIPDMTSWSKESAHWIANYFLNASISGDFSPPMNAYAYNFLRRTQYAFSEHELPRGSTLAFVLGGSKSPRGYADALFHWETFLGQTWHAFAILVTAFQGKAFEKNDGSMEQRLNALYNQMKHVESRIDNAQMLPGATVPVWLDNDGLRSIDAHLSYGETANALKELAKFADALSNPNTAKAVLSADDA